MSQFVSQSSKCIKIIKKKIIIEWKNMAFIKITLKKVTQKFKGLFNVLFNSILDWTWSEKWVAMLTSAATPISWNDNVLSS